MLDAHLMDVLRTDVAALASLFLMLTLPQRTHFISIIFIYQVKFLKLLLFTRYYEIIEYQRKQTRTWAFSKLVVDAEGNRILF